MAKWWKPVVLTALLAVAGACFLSRPSVYFQLETASETYDPARGPLRVQMKFRNGGQIWISVRLVLVVQGATIAPLPPEPYIEATQRELKILYGLDPGTKDYLRQPADVIPDKGGASFTISYSVEKSPHLSASGLVGFVFGEVIGYFPISLTYARIADGTYRIKS